MSRYTQEEIRLNVLPRILRPIVAVIVLVAGTLLAMTLAFLSFIAALSIGVALWIAARYGAGRIRRDASRAREGTDVIDIEMREIEREPAHRASDTAR